MRLSDDLVDPVPGAFCNTIRGLISDQTTLAEDGRITPLYIETVIGSYYYLPRVVPAECRVYFMPEASISRWTSAIWAETEGEEVPIWGYGSGP